MKAKRLLIGLVFLSLLGLSNPLRAEITAIETAVEWLKSHQNEDYTWGKDNPSLEEPYLVSRFQATCTVLDAFHDLGIPTDENCYSNALDWLEEQTAPNNRYLAQQIEALARAGRDVTSLVEDTLKPSRNKLPPEGDGGWGTASGHEGDVLDTVLAFRALEAAGALDDSLIQQSLVFLTSYQKTDGSWGYHHGRLGYRPEEIETNIYVTSLVLITLSYYQTEYTEIAGNVTAAKNWLLPQQNVDGSFGASIFETALAYSALVHSSYDCDEIQTALGYLQSQQKTDGSWNQNPFETSLAAKAVNETAPEEPERPDLTVTDMSRLPVEPATGDTVTVKAEITNEGDVGAANVVVKFYHGDPRTDQYTYIDQRTISTLAASASEWVEVYWDTTGIRGEEKIYVFVDPDNTIDESDEADNLAYTVIPVGTRPDLSIVSDDIVLSESPYVAGEPITISATIRNLGGTAALGVVVQFFDNDPGNGGKQIHSDINLGTIPAGLPGTINLTTRLAPGTYRIYVKVDPENTIQEQDEGNNIASITEPITVTYPASSLPDLFINSANIAFSPAVPQENEQVTIYARVWNLGGQSTGDFAVEFFNGDPEGAGQSLGEVPGVSSISAGGYQIVSLGTSFTSAGNYDIYVQVDSGEAVTESDEDNNLAFKTLSVAPAGTSVDLAVSSDNITFTPENPKAGEKVTITAIVVNQGTAAVSDVVVQFYNGNPDNGGTQIGGDAVFSFIPGGTPGEAQLLVTFAEGPYDIYVEVDPDDTIQEQDETNNTASISLTVGPGASKADLALDSTDISFSHNTPTHWDTIIIYAEVTNEGTVNVTDDFTVKFLVGNPYEEDAVYLGEDTIIGGLLAGSSATAEINWTVWGGQEPTCQHEIYVLVDLENVVYDEITKSNNLAFKSITVNSLSDLMVDGSTLSVSHTNLSEGRTVTVCVTVSNIGPVPVSGAEVLFRYETSVEPGIWYGINTRQIDLAPGETKEVEVLWQPLVYAGISSYDCTVEVWADPDDLIPELDPSNNYASLSGLTIEFSEGTVEIYEYVDPDYVPCTSFGAYETVYIDANHCWPENDPDVGVLVIVTDETWEDIYYPNPPDDEMDYHTWYTSSYDPGGYDVVAYIYDVPSGLILEIQQESFTIHSTTAFGAVYLHNEPRYLVVDDARQQTLALTMTLINKSNVNATITADYQVLDPASSVIFQGQRDINLVPGYIVKDYSLDEFSHTYVDDGMYSTTIDIIHEGQNVTSGSKDFRVLAERRIEATKTVEPNNIYPGGDALITTTIDLTGYGEEVPIEETAIDVVLVMDVSGSMTGSINESEIFLSSGTSPRQISVNFVADERPQIDNGYVVWQQCVEGEYDWEIFLYDIVNESTARITDNGSHDNDPSISNGMVIWKGYDSGYGIFVYDISIGQMIDFIPTGSTGNNPDISNDIVVWQERPAGTSYDEIFFYDLSSPSPEKIRITNNSFRDEYPAVSGNMVVWQARYGGYDYAICFCDLSTYPNLTVNRLTDNNCYDEYPDVSNGTVVWQRKPPGEYDYEIYSYDLNSYPGYPDPGGENRITDDNRDDEHPAICGGQVVWQSERWDEYLSRDEWENYYEIDYEIFLWDESSPADIIQINDDVDDDVYPAISNGQVVWQSNMNAWKINAAKRAARTFIEIVDDNDGEADVHQVGVVPFTTSVVGEDWGYQSLTTDKEAAIAAVKKMGPLDNTNMAAGLHEAGNMFNTYGNPDHVWAVLVLSDGRPNAGGGMDGAEDEADALDVAGGVQIYAIGFGPSALQDKYQDFLKYRIATTGDKYFYCPSDEALAAVFAGIAEELLKYAGSGLTVTDTIPLPPLGAEYDPVSNPASRIPDYDETIIDEDEDQVRVLTWEWGEQENFLVDQTETITVPLTVTEPVPGEDRMVNKELQLTYNDYFGIRVTITLPPQYVHVLQSAFETALSTDKQSYGADENVVIQAAATNVGEITKTLNARLLIEDVGGGVVEELLPQWPQPLSVAPDTKNWNLEDTIWNTGSTYAGNYHVHLVLEEDGTGTVVGEDYTGFTIVPPSNPIASEVRTDKIAYGPNETVWITSEVTNLARNYDYENVEIRLRVSQLDEGGDPIPGADWFIEPPVTIGTLFAEKTESRQDSWETDINPPATYRVTQDVYLADDPVCGDTAEFEIKQIPVKALSGTIEVWHLEGGVKQDELYRWEDLVVEYKVTNVGNVDLVGLDLEVLIVDPNDPALPNLVDTSPVNASSIILPVQAAFSRTGTLEQLDLTHKDYRYMVILQGVVDEEVIPVASTHFTVLAPPLTVESEVSGTNRVLVWTDSGDTTNIEDIEAALAQAGLEETYLLVHDDDDFVKYLRSGLYNVYVIMDTQHPLTGYNDKEFVEKIYGGEGGIYTGKAVSDNIRNLLGLDVTGETNENSVTLYETPEFGDLPETLPLVTGTRVDTTALSDPGAPHVLVGSVPGSVTIVGKDYGEGRSVYYGFDTAEATDRTLVRDLLGRSLSYIDPGSYPIRFAWDVIPYVVTISITSGAPMDLRIEDKLPLAINIVEPYDYDTEGDYNIITWDVHVSPGDTVTLEYFVESPGDVGSYNVDRTVYFLNDDGNYQTYKVYSPAYTLDVASEQTWTGLKGEIDTELEAYYNSIPVGNNDRGTVDNIRGNIADLTPDPTDTSQSYTENKCRIDLHQVVTQIDWLKALTSGDLSLRDSSRVLLDYLLGIYESAWYYRFNADEIVDDDKPTASITSPFRNAILSGTVDIVAAASDNKEVLEVEFFVVIADTDISLGTDTLGTDGWSWSWDTTLEPEGKHFLKVKAVDADGNFCYSHKVRVNVNNSDATPPSAPVIDDPGLPTYSGNVDVQMTVEDDEAVARAEVRVDGMLRETRFLDVPGQMWDDNKTRNFTFVWDTRTVQDKTTHTIKLKTYDWKGNVSSEQTLGGLYVDNTVPDVISPTAQITSPAANSQVKGTVTVCCQAIDERGIERVEFYLDEDPAPRHTDYSAPYTWGWDTTGETDGSYTLKVTAYDTSGNATDYQHLVVVDNEKPTVSQTVTLRAEADDNLAVEKVEFLINGEVAETLTSPPYLYEWDISGCEPGSYAVTIKIYDTAGNESTSTNQVNVSK